MFCFVISKFTLQLGSCPSILFQLGWLHVVYSLPNGVKQTRKSLGCHQVSSLDMNILSHPQGVATAVVYSTADGAMWAKDRDIGRFRRSVTPLGTMESNHGKQKTTYIQLSSIIQDSRYHGWWCGFFSFFFSMSKPGNPKQLALLEPSSRFRWKAGKGKVP